jgi:DNA-binding CsgD family transcriptional regulator
VFGLTTAESELAVALTQGSTLTECAQRRGVTINTAKTQLRHILNKAGTHRQSELVRPALLLVPLKSPREP